MAYSDLLDSQILNIIETHRLSDQKDLQDLLQDHGWHIPQATLSRRLRKLGISKVEGYYQTEGLKGAHLPLVLNIQVSAPLIILHTQPGQANGLAFFLDQKYVSFSPHNTKKSGILGTVAGDDTLLIVTEGQSVIRTVLEALKKDFSYLKMPVRGGLKGLD